MKNKILLRFIVICTGVLLFAGLEVMDAWAPTQPINKEPVKTVLSTPSQRPLSSEAATPDTSAVPEKTTSVTFDLQARIDETPAGGELALPFIALDLEGKTITITKPLRIIGQGGNLLNGHITIMDTRDVSLEGLDTSAFYVVVRNVENIRIEKCSFRNLRQDIWGAVTIQSGCNNVKILNNHFEDIDYITSSTTFGCGIKMEVIDDIVRGIEISGNEFLRIHGPAAIWLGGTNLVLDGFVINGNSIQWTESFGIEFFQIDAVTLKNGMVSDNTIEDIGLLRKAKDGKGSGGIYSNCISETVDVVGNHIARVVEIGIEGRFTRVMDNYVEDTGTDQLNHPIRDNAGIYWGGSEVSGNVIINPGDNGGLHLYTQDRIHDFLCKRNTIMNRYPAWSEKSVQTKGDLVLVRNNVYVCMQEGTTGGSPPAARNASIKDGSCLWDFKKTMPTTAIRLNGVLGMERVSIQENIVSDFVKFAYFSGYIGQITIQQNGQYQAGKSDAKITVEGYGSRKCPGLVSQAISFTLPSIP